MPNPDTIIFLHIPKTAGTTLNAILQKQYKPQQIYYLGANAQESIRDYQQLARAEKEAIRLVSGHTALGFHDYVPGSSTYFTFLRDPIERVVSFYYYVKKNNEHYLNRAAVNEFEGIAPFINSGITKMVDNGQTRMISGVWLEPAFGKITAQEFEQAKANLKQRFSVTGLTEQFDATLLLFRAIFNWQSITYIRQNVSKTAAADRELAAVDRQAIEAANQWDIALYEHAQELFAEQIAALGDGFPRQLASFQRQNDRYQRLIAPLQRTLQQARQFSVRAKIRTIFTP